MSRKRCNRQRVIALPPRGLRPKLDAGQRRDLSLAHIANLDTICHGHADEGVLWQVVGGVLTWAKVAEVLGQGIEEMTRQVDLVQQLVDRFGRHGRVGFTGPEYQLAKEGVIVMDLLAEIVDRPTAIAAAEWSERRVEAMSAQCAQKEAA